jgi:hypothetical protein
MKSFYELSIIAEEHLYREDLASFASTIWSKVGQSIPGTTPQEKAEVALDTIGTALDAAGLVDPSGIADGTNAVIHTLRAAASKDPDFRKRHLFDALISAVSIIPFADLAKLLKARKMRGGAKAVVKYARPLQNVAQTAIRGRMAGNQAQLMPQWNQTLGAGAAPVGTAMGMQQPVA